METVYLETTIVGNIAGRMHRNPDIAAQQRLTRDWWKYAPGRLEIFISQLVVDECSNGDPVAAHERLDVLRNLRLLDVSQDCLDLAARLLANKAVPPSEPRDALHIAIAAVHRVNYLLTWNFKHIANAVMRHHIEYVVREAGYEPPVICTPQELRWEETDD